MDIRDSLSSIKDAMVSRVYSPLSGAFILSWVLWNYRFLLVLFSSMSARQKISYIDSNYFTSGSDIFLRGFLFPLLSALIYLYLYPVVSKKVYEYTKARSVELEDLKNKLERQRLITAAEADRIKEGELAVKAKLRKATDEFRSEIESLERINGEKEETIKGLMKDLEVLREKLESFRNANKDVVSLRLPRHAIVGLSESDLEGRKCIFHFNPNSYGKKEIVLGPNHMVLGGNDNEHTWKVENSFIDFYNSGNKHFSRFEQTSDPLVWRHVLQKYLAPNDQYFEIKSEADGEEFS